MKIAKKTAAFLLVLFLGIQCMPLTALAADGTLSFSDPTAKAGETIEVTVKINTAEGPIGDGQVQVTDLSGICQTSQCDWTSRNDYAFCIWKWNRF